MIVADQSTALAIQIQLNKSDISQSVKQRAVRTPFFWIVPLWMVVMVKFVLDSNLHVSWWCGLVSALAAGVLTLVFLLYRGSALISKQPAALAPMTFVFSAYGITNEFENGTNKSAWSLVKGARETGHFFFIEMQRRSFHLIPKRFLTDEQASRLREILSTYVKNVHLQGQPPSMS